ncbi:ATP-binding protein [Spirosoma migulaei]
MANEFNRHHILQLPDDRIILGGIEGITTFNPSQVKNDTFQPRVELTGIQINNRQIEPGKGSPLGELPIHALSELSLLSNQNYLNFEFASLQYNKEKKTRYRYRMEGLDADWIVVNRPMASYTDLKPGYYTLFINASNSSGVWSKHVRTFRIKIHPPLWATWWAYTIYGLLLVALLYGIFRTYANRLQLQQSVILKQNEVELTIKEAQQLKNIDEIKTRFFTNITHEFKTPLTLIIAPTHYLINELSQTKYARQLASIEQNANQLLRLINQLLDLSKIEASAMEVHESRGNPGVFIGQILDSFTELANQKGVELTYHNQATSDYLFDASLLERIIYNLVSNALKFTPTGGNVTVQLNAANGITLVIADNGIGIPSEKIAAVFERFVQADTSSTRTHEGTGIGLALVKELVDLQQGTIRIDSEVDSLTNQHGTTITLQLPYRQVEPLTGPIDKALDIRESRSEAVPIVLLVEDNPDMATLIIDCLPTTYQFIWAKNGVVGLAQAVSQLPDLIISDVLMPEMDGYTLCQTLKADVRTNHIPLILLTAKSSVESRLEGLSVGADDYLTKPFLLPELQLRIRNLLERQKLLRELIRKSFIKIDQDDMQLTIVDPFLAKLYACIDAKLDDSAYGVEELANDIGMSRYTLHRKTKTLTTMLPNELIRNYRLKRSLSFLRKGNTVAETAVLVGFDSPSYFTKCFRNHYNITPKQLLQQAGTENNIE